MEREREKKIKLTKVKESNCIHEPMTITIAHHDTPRRYNRTESIRLN